MHAVGSLTWPRSSTKTAMDSTHDTAERFFFFSGQMETNKWKQQFLPL